MDQPPSEQRTGWFKKPDPIFWVDVLNNYRMNASARAIVGGQGSVQNRYLE